MLMAKPSRESKFFIPLNLQMFADNDDIPVDDDLADDVIQDDDAIDDADDVEPNNDEPADDEDEYLDLGDKNPVYNGETRKVKKEEAKDLLQKGYNYDKVHGKAQNLETQLQRAARVQGFSTVDAYLEAVERAEMEAEAVEYARTNNLTAEEAQRELARDKRVQALEHEVKVTKLLSNLEAEKTPYRDKMYFKELESEIDKLVKESAMRGQKLDVEVAFNFLRGQKLDELMSKAKSETAKSTVAKIHDRARRGPTSSDGASGDDVDTTDVDLKMAQAFGNDPKAIAKYVKKAIKK